jgi:hypothetical protein
MRSSGEGRNVDELVVATATSTARVIELPGS